MKIRSEEISLFVLGSKMVTKHSCRTSSASCNLMLTSSAPFALLDLNKAHDIPLTDVWLDFPSSFWRWKKTWKLLYIISKQLSNKHYSKSNRKSDKSFTWRTFEHFSLQSQSPVGQFVSPDTPLSLKHPTWTIPIIKKWKTSEHDIFIFKTHKRKIK